MNSLQTIPLMFGVTGHRDLLEDDILELKTTISTLLNDYRTNYSNTEIIVISALADGADMLVAQVAQQLKIPLHVILPYNQDDYLYKSVKDEKLFKELLAYAGENVKTLDCHQNEKGKFTHCYQQLGEYIADRSNILIALWNGVEELENNGGTAAIVRYKRYGCGENIFDSRDGNAIVVIPTAREKDRSEPKNHLNTSVEYLGRLSEKGFEENLRKFDHLNTDILNYNDAFRNIYISSTLNPLLQYKKFFGDKANNNQKNYKSLLVWLFSFIGFAIIFLEVMHVFSGVDDLRSWSGHIVIGYFASLSIAYFYIYKVKMKTGGLQDDFIYSRGLSEAIRIQNAWNAIGLNKRVSAYFLRGEPSKFTWMRIALKNIDYIDSSNYESEIDWVQGQILYFKKSIKERDQNINKLKKSEEHFFKFGLVGVSIAFLMYFLEAIHWIPHWHFPYNWHFAILFSGVALIFTAFTKKYLHIHAFKEDKDNFEEILPVFEIAADLLGIDVNDKDNHNITENKKLLDRVIFDLGKKALVEHSQWVGLHDARRAKFEME